MRKIIKSCVKQRAAVYLTLVMLLSACAGPHKLAGTPNINIWQKTPSQVSNREDANLDIAEIYYVTDRNMQISDDEKINFGDQRSDSMTFGKAGLLLNKLKSNSSQDTSVSLDNVLTLREFPATPLPLIKTNGTVVVEPEIQFEYQESIKEMQMVLSKHLQENNQKDLILFVHGFNNSFEDALFSLHDLWHFSERQSIPLVYSWPSGSKSLLNYFTDRESGEFTIYHLKETLRILASIENLENIHIIAHSRGTDVTTTALRELMIEARGESVDPRKALKVKNLILAAPDLDYGVVKQRLLAEQFGRAFGQITIYMNADDSALGISQFLMKGIRFGRLLANQQGVVESKIFEAIDNVAFVNVEDVSGLVGHGYFHQHPGVMSDIIALVTKNEEPGSASRPLKHIRSNFWAIDNQYLLPTSDK